MEVQSSAAIEIQGALVRYAEVVRSGDDDYRLVRLGSCEFDFDVEAAAHHPYQPAHLEALQEALTDIFAGSSALDLHIALHPLICSSFFVPILANTPPGLREEQLRQEAAYIAPGEDPVVSAELTRPEVLPDGEAVNWFHVMALKPKLAEQFEQMVNPLSVSRQRFCTTTGSAAAILRHIARQQTADTSVHTPYRLAIGSYQTHTEFALCRNQGWLFGYTTTTASPEDGAYFAVALLRRLQIRTEELGGLFLYGTQTNPADFNLLKRVLAIEPQPLNPLSAVDHDAEGLTSSFNAELYVPCIGATLRDVYP